MILIDHVLKRFRSSFIENALQPGIGFVSVSFFDIKTCQQPHHGQVAIQDHFFLDHFMDMLIDTAIHNWRHFKVFTVDVHIPGRRWVVRL